MFRPALLRAPAAIAAFALAPPALADLTAEEVWTSWQAGTAGTGSSLVAGDQSRSGNRLILLDVTATVDDGTTRAVVTVPEVILIEQGDGTVRVEPAPEYRIDYLSGEAGEPDIELSMLLSHEGLEMVAAGEAEEIEYRYTASGISMTGATEPDDEITTTLDVGFSDISGTSTVRAGSPQSATQIYDFGSVTANVTTTDADENVTLSFAVRFEDWSTSQTGNISVFSASRNMADSLREGLESAGTTTYGPVTYKVERAAPDRTNVVEGSFGSGSVSASVDASGLIYETTGNDATIQVSGTTPMPLTATIKAEELSTRFRMPLIPQDGAQDLGLSLRLAGMEFDPFLWSMIDPGGALPRDPGNLEIDISGKGQLNADLTSATEMPSNPGALGKLDSVTINAADLSLAGASLTAFGAFAFDNSSMPPRPAGQVNLRLVGGNALLDTLTAIGILPQDRAMTARMMLGLFARPGEGADTLVSTIEVQPDGSVLANGQRIR